jgi:hypothetical protein
MGSWRAIWKARPIGYTWRILIAKYEMAIENTQEPVKIEEFASEMSIANEPYVAIR